MKKYHDQRQLFERKYVIGGCFTVSEAYSVIAAGSMDTGMHGARVVAGSYMLIHRPRQRETEPVQGL